jgi:hypothetical protein
MGPLTLITWRTEVSYQRCNHITFDRFAREAGHGVTATQFQSVLMPCFSPNEPSRSWLCRPLSGHQDSARRAHQHKMQPSRQRRAPAMPSRVILFNEELAGQVRPLLAPPGGETSVSPPFDQLDDLFAELFAHMQQFQPAGSMYRSRARIRRRRPRRSRDSRSRWRVRRWRVPTDRRGARRAAAAAR